MQTKRPFPLTSIMLFIALPFTFLSCSAIINKLGGNFKYEPEQMENNISPEAQQLMERSFEGSEGK